MGGMPARTVGQTGTHFCLRHECTFRPYVLPRRAQLRRAETGWRVLCRHKTFRPVARAAAFLGGPRAGVSPALNERVFSTNADEHWMFKVAAVACTR